MNRQYLIPANSKRSMLIFNTFTGVDLGILLTGIGISFLMWMFFPVNDISWAIISLIPISLAGFLVIPIPNYHNVRTILTNAIKFYSDPYKQRYIWKGWCFDSGERNKK